MKLATRIRRWWHSQLLALPLPYLLPYRLSRPRPIDSGARQVRVLLPLRWLRLLMMRYTAHYRPRPTRLVCVAPCNRFRPVPAAWACHLLPRQLRRIHNSLLQGQAHAECSRVVLCSHCSRCPSVCLANEDCHVSHGRGEQQGEQESTRTWYDAMLGLRLWPDTLAPSA